MNFVARCPACGTTFRVQKTQLAARDGRVRCGKCATVFNGVAALIEDEAPAADATATVTPGPGDRAAESFARIAAAAQRSFLWGFLALLMLLGLLAQVLLHFRTGLAVQWPAARAPFAIACELLGCELHLPRQADQLSIESSDVQPDRLRDNVVVLNAVVRNRAPFAQDYPALELTLTDERDFAVLRRVLLPADYLRFAANERATAGIAGGAEAVLRVHLENAGPRAAGYRLYLFYPRPGA